jgi:hypothetical protein
MHLGMVKAMHEQSKQKLKMRVRGEGEDVGALLTRVQDGQCLTLA